MTVCARNEQFMPSVLMMENIIIMIRASVVVLDALFICNDFFNDGREILCLIIEEQTK